MPSFASNQLHLMVYFLVYICFAFQLRFTEALAFAQPLFDRREWMIQATVATASTSNALVYIPFLQQDQSILHYPGTAATPPLDIPRVGYSLYKTNVTQAALGVQLALQAGVRHFDLASMYGSNEQVGSVLRPYIDRGLEGVADSPISSKQRRRRQLFLTLKVPPASTKSIVQQTVQAELDKLGVSYVDLVMIHSPLAESSSSRLLSYEALLELQRDGIAKGVGVCHFGVGPLNELVSAGLPPPAVIQLILSPFHQHKDVAAWAQEHGSILSCNAWSMLSSINGPQEGWDKLAKIAKAKGIAKPQTKPNYLDFLIRYLDPTTRTDIPSSTIHHLRPTCCSLMNRKPNEYLTDRFLEDKINS